MYRRDYIMRHIEFMVEALQQISGLTKEKQYGTALTTIDESLETLFGLNGTLLTRRFGQEPLSQVAFGQEADVRQAKLIAAAALLNEAGEIHVEKGNEAASFHSFASALELLLVALLDDDGSPLPDYIPEVDQLTETLAPFHLPIHLTQLLLRFYHKQGQFDRAEDVLFEMLDEAPKEDTIIEQGINFYRLILAESDIDLETGNLPREEAEASLAELLALRPNV